MSWLDDVKARLKAAHQGPWKWERNEHGSSILDAWQGVITISHVIHSRHDADHELMAHAPTDLQRAVCEIETLRNDLYAASLVILQGALPTNTVLASLNAHRERMEEP